MVAMVDGDFNQFSCHSFPEPVQNCSRTESGESILPFTLTKQVIKVVTWSGKTISQDAAYRFFKNVADFSFYY